MEDLAMGSNTDGEDTDEVDAQRKAELASSRRPDSFLAKKANRYVQSLRVSTASIRQKEFDRR